MIVLRLVLFDDSLDRHFCWNIELVVTPPSADHEREHHPRSDEEKEWETRRKKKVRAADDHSHRAREVRRQLATRRVRACVISATILVSTLLHEY
jgi:hypothetical protein